MRLDSYLLQKGFFDSRTKAKQAVERGEILINGKKILKSAYEINEFLEYSIDYVATESYVSLGGYKLKKALIDFDFSVQNLVCADLGSSTGGFTDCLIKNGANYVYAVDLNDTLLHKSLRKNPKVNYLIKNVKDLTKDDFNEEIDLVTVDLSFISSTVIFDRLKNILTSGKYIILLIKPQFESDKKMSFKNGIIKDDKIRFSRAEKVINKAIEYGFYPQKFTSAPISQEKNVEYLVLLQNGVKSSFNLKEYF